MDTLPADWEKDKENAARFFETQPADMRQSMIKVIEEAAKKDPPLIYVHIDGGLSDKNVDKLSAFRILAEEMGWEIAAFDVNSISHTVSAHMRPFRVQ